MSMESAIRSLCAARLLQVTEVFDSAQAAYNQSTKVVVVLRPCTLTPSPNLLATGAQERAPYAVSACDSCGMSKTVPLFTIMLDMSVKSTHATDP